MGSPLGLSANSYARRLKQPGYHDFAQHRRRHVGFRRGDSGAAGIGVGHPNPGVCGVGDAAAVAGGRYFGRYSLGAISRLTYATSLTSEPNFSRPAGDHSARLDFTRFHDSVVSTRNCVVVAIAADHRRRGDYQLAADALILIAASPS